MWLLMTTEGGEGQEGRGGVGMALCVVVNPRGEGSLVLVARTFGGGGVAVAGGCSPSMI